MAEQKVMQVEGDMLRGMVKPVDDPNLVLEIKSILYAIMENFTILKRLELNY